MRVVIASDKFKGCLTAEEAAEAMAKGVRSVEPGASIDLCPMSDGGEGFVRAMVRARDGRLVTRRVTGPLPDMKVDATFGILPCQGNSWTHSTNEGPVAVIEMSSASGIELLPDARDHNPEATTTFGTGELLLAAVEEGCRSIILGIGGSATIDGGIGCCHAAGLPVLLDGGEPTSLTEPLCGRDLPRVVRIKSHRGDRLAGVDLIVACDVANPLYGPSGAARVFGKQKGATDAQIEQFDQWLSALARRCDKDDVAQLPGAGAAGGLGFAMMAFFGAAMQPGAELVIQVNQFAERLRNADICLTGEGRFDASSAAGKAPFSIAGLCRSMNVPCHAICGDADAEISHPFQSIESLTRLAGSSDAAIRNARALVAQAAATVIGRHL